MTTYYGTSLYDTHRYRDQTAKGFSSGGFGQIKKICTKCGGYKSLEGGKRSPFICKDCK